MAETKWPTEYTASVVDPSAVLATTAFAGQSNGASAYVGGLGLV